MAKSKRQIRRQGETKITKLIKKEILKKDAFDTGRMLRSVAVTSVQERSGMTFTISAVDYYTYVDEGTERIDPRNITKDVVDSREFERITKDMLGEYAEALVDEAFNGLGSKDIYIS